MLAIPSSPFPVFHFIFPADYLDFCVAESWSLNSVEHGTFYFFESLTPHIRFPVEFSVGWQDAIKKTPKLLCIRINICASLGVMSEVL